ncbi:MAG: peptide chain release factor N(5)-glutamine methyltransferase [Pseudomonadota bacterium]
MWRFKPEHTHEELFRLGADILKTSEHQDPLRISRSLYLAASELTETDLILKAHERPNEDIFLRFKEFIERASKNEPISKILGHKEFFNQDFIVTHDTLDPREDSETLIQAILEEYDAQRSAPYKILDIGTGSGCLAITCAKIFPKSHVMGLDISEKALIVASNNAVRANVGERCSFEISNFGEDIFDRFDIIVSNPPYIPTAALHYLDASVRDFDPFEALDGGDGGFECYKTIARILPALCLSSTGLFLEVGIGQAAYVKEIFSASGFTGFKFYTDTQRIIRCVSCRYSDQE